jgi:hypothetical protein
MKSSFRFLSLKIRDDLAKGCYQSEVNCKFAQAVKILSRRAVEPFEVDLTKQLFCVVDPNAGRIEELLIRRVANRFLRQESQNL